MPILSGISPLTIKLTEAILDLASSLKPMQPYRGVVHHTPKGAQVLVAGTRIPLPKGSPLQAGQTVIVTHQAGADGAKLLIQLAPQAATPPSAAPSLSAPLALLKTLMDESPLLQGLSTQQATR